MTRKEIDIVLAYASSCTSFALPGVTPMGVARFQAFLAIKPLLRDRNYWYALGQAYSDSDDLYDYRVDIKLAFLSEHPGRQHLMNCRERAFLARLPDRLRIYRGMTTVELHSGQFGVPWTLDRSVAEYFAFTYPRNFPTSQHERVVHQLFVNKREVIAYFNDREESEIIYISQYDRSRAVLPLHLSALPAIANFEIP